MALESRNVMDVSRKIVRAWFKALVYSWDRKGHILNAISVKEK